MVRSSMLLMRECVQTGLSLPLASLAFALAVPFALLPSVSMAQEAAPVADATAATAPAATAALDPALKKSADDFWHYTTIARYELAGAEAEKLAAADPYAVYKAFQAVAADRSVDLDSSISRWKNVTALKDQVGKLTATLEKGELSLKEDQSFIESNIKRLVINERAYQLALSRLRQSGELAVPQMVQWLRSTEQVQYHGAIRRALTEMGKSALSPLLAATEMKDSRVLSVIVTILGEMGYDSATPYLLKLSANPEVSASVRSAAASSLAKLNVSRNTTAADAFYELAEKYYYEKSMISADPAGPSVGGGSAYVWNWSEDKGLTKVDVPPAIFNEVMSMMAAEQALSLDRGKEQALSLWLAANYKREAELPEGGKDLTRPAGSGDANYYGVTSGARYLNDVLFRALRDKNSAVALKATKSLEQIVGTSSLFNGANNGGASTPLTAALSYPDRLVRFEAAYTVGASMPAQAFPGSEQVVPTLAEMVSQTGKPGVLIVAKTDADVTKWVEAFKGLGYNATGGTTAEAAFGKSMTIPSVDAVVISEDAGLGTVDSVLALTGSSPRVALAPKIIITRTGQSVYAGRAATDTLVNITQATEPEAIKAEVAKALARAGTNASTEASALEAAKRSLGLLKSLALSKNGVLDLQAAKPALLSAVDDARPEVAMAAGEVLAMIGGKEGQLTLAKKAVAEGTSPELKVSMLHSLALSAKMSGNVLPTDAVAALEKVVVGSDSMEVRSAAAEARGALNLPPEEAKTLILGSAK